MKTIPASLILFFTFITTASASIKTSYDYGLPELVEIIGVQSSDDGDWVKYRNELYRRIDLPPYRCERVSFTGKGLPVVGAKSPLKEKDEFIYWGRNEYQKFRPNWKPTPPLKVEERSWSALTAFGVGMTCFIASFARFCRTPRQTR